MNDVLFQMYMQTKNLVKKAKGLEIGSEQRQLVDEWNQAIEILDAAEPNYKTRYDRLVKYQESFTPEQIDFICYQIGDWYLEWKDRLVIDLKKGTHRLGYAKEQLKTIICGE